MKSIHFTLAGVAIAMIVAIFALNLGLAAALEPSIASLIINVCLLILAAAVVVMALYMDREKGVNKSLGDSLKGAQVGIKKRDKTIVKRNEEIVRLTIFEEKWIRLVESAKAAEATQLEEQVGILKSFMSQHSELRVYSNVVDDMEDLIIADKFLRKFQRNYIEPLHSQLDSMEMPLTQEQIDNNLKSLIEVAALCFDFVDSYHPTIENPQEQQIGLSVVREEKSLEEALRESFVANDIATQTPRWIRVLRNSLKGLDFDMSQIIVSGFKL